MPYLAYLVRGARTVQYKSPGAFEDGEQARNRDRIRLEAGENPLLALHFLPFFLCFVFLKRAQRASQTDNCACVKRKTSLRMSKKTRKAQKNDKFEIQGTSNSASKSKIRITLRLRRI